MSPETESFLDAVRSAEDPSRADEERVLSAVRAAVATGVVVGTAAGTSKLLKLLSGCPVIVVDTSDGKLELATEMGADHTINATSADAAGTIRELTKGHGVCAAFDFVGSDATLGLAVASTRSLGKVSHVGLAGGTAALKPLANSRFEVLYEATLWGTIQELREVIALAESGRLTTIPIEIAPLEKINDVYRRLKAGEIIGRAVIAPML